MDFYQTATSTLTWNDCRVDAAGSAVGDATMSVTIANNAPADAASLPSYITGGGSFGVEPGIARTVAYVYLPEGWELADATMSNGAGFGGGMHDGRRVVSFSVDLAPGQSVTAAVTAKAVAPGATTIELVGTPTIAPVADVEATCGYT
jgi:hypothetical protein